MPLTPEALLVRLQDSLGERIVTASVPLRILE